MRSSAGRRSTWTWPKPRSCHASSARAMVSASAGRLAGAPGRPPASWPPSIVIPAVTVSVAGSRPSASQAAMRSARREAKRSSGKPNQAAFQASAWRATSRSIRSPSAGDQDRHAAREAGRAGRRRDQDGVVDLVPAAVERHPLAAQQRQDDRRATPRTGRRGGRTGSRTPRTPARASPCPGPGSAGRAAISSRLPPSSPSRAGGRKPVPSTIVPSSARSVAAASAASSVVASWMPSSGSSGQAEDEVVVDPQAVDAAGLGGLRQGADAGPGAGARAVRFAHREHDADLHRAMVPS